MVTFLRAHSSTSSFFFHSRFSDQPFQRCHSSSGEEFYVTNAVAVIVFPDFKSDRSMIVTQLINERVIECVMGKSNSLNLPVR